MDLTRRNYLKAKAAAVAAAAAGAPLSADAANVVLPGDEARLTWSKAPCRFCGTGCGVMVGVKRRPGGRDPRRHPCRGQPRPQLRQGLFPVQDHVRQRPADQPLLRKKDGQYAKDGEFKPVTWEQRLRRDGRAMQAHPEGERPDRRRHVRLRPVDDVEGYAALKLMKAASAATTSIPTRATAWPRPPTASCAHSAWTSRWAATTISRPPMHSCSGAPTWRRCTRSCGPASPTAASAIRM